MLALEWKLSGWRSASEARDLLGEGVRLLARKAGEGVSFAAADLSVAEATVRRSAVLLRSERENAAAFLFDAASVPFSWHFSEPDVHVILPPRPREETLALACTDAADTLRGIDLVGACWRDWVVLFHAGLTVAHSSVSFDAGRGRKYLVTGLGPGSWDVWRDGWLDEMGLPVRPAEAALRFDGEPGSFFIRKFG